LATAVFLPATDEQTAKLKTDTPLPARPNSGVVMVVDDDMDFGDMVSISLERLGYEAAVFDDPEMAVRLMDEDPAVWDALITD
jgi:CheY-like chemotaxis protein